MKSYRFLLSIIAIFLMLSFFGYTHATTVVEVEPNDTISAPQDISLPAAGEVLTIEGLPSVGVDGNVDYYRFTAQPGTFVIFDIDGGYGVGDSFDSFLVLLDEEGTVLSTNDYFDYEWFPDPGSMSSYDSMLAHLFDRSGTYFIVVSNTIDTYWLDYPLYHVGDYDLVITTRFLEPIMIVEAEPNDTFSAPQDIELPETGQIVIKGLPPSEFDYYGTLDYFRFTAQAGQSVAFDIDAGAGIGNADEYYYYYDPYLVLLDSEGTEIAAADDWFQVDPGSADYYDPLLFYEFTESGTYYLVVSECCHYDPYYIDYIGDYILFITSVTPLDSPLVVSEVEPNDALTVPQLISLPFNGQMVIQGLPSVGVDGNLDFYRFSITTPSTVIFDIDEGERVGDSFDSFLVLLDSDGNLIGVADDSWPLDPGSVDRYDSLFLYDFDIPGDYYMVVSHCCDETVLDGVLYHIGDYKLVITSVSPSAVADIPTLSEWGMIIMAALMGLYAALHIRKRHKAAAQATSAS